MAVRNIFRHKARSTITLSTIVFGCVALIFVGGFFADMFDQAGESYINDHTGHIQVYKKGFNQNGRKDPFSYLIADAEKLRGLILKIPEVDSVTFRIEFSGLMSTGENTISFMGQGVDPRYEKTVAGKDNFQDLKKMYSHGHFIGLPVLEAGKGLESSDPYGIILGRGLASSMDIQPSNSVTLLTNTVSGSTNAMDMNVRGIFYTTFKNFDDIFLRMPLTTVQKLLNTDSVQTVIIKLHRTEDTANAKEKLQQLFQERKLALEIKTWEELSDFYTKTVALFNAFHLIMRIVVSIVVVLGIFNTMNMAVMERTSEIGTMMALGVRRKGVLQLFLCEGLVMGLVGGILGIAVGSIIVNAIAAVGIPMPPSPGMTMKWLSHPSVVPKVLVSTFCLSVLMGGISSLYPAYKASRLVIAEALRYR